MPQHGGAGVVEHHAGNMEHAAHHVDGVFRILKAFLQLFGGPVAVLHLDVVPGVHVDFFDAARVNIFGEERKLRHLGIDGIHKLLFGHAGDSDAVVPDILGGVPLDLRPGFAVATADDEVRVAGRDEFLDLAQHGAEFAVIALG